MTKATTKSDYAHDEIGLFQILVLVLSVFVLCAIMAQTFFTLPPEINFLLNRLDTLICFIFIGDFFYRLLKAESKVKFLHWGWIDLISSIPAVEILRWGRIVRIVRMLRVMRAFRSVKFVIGYVYRKRSRATFSTAAVTAFLVAIFSSVAILTFENIPGANINTAGDGLWWSFYTLANIDYAGHYPLSVEGKVIRLMLVVTGMVLFGIFTGYVASFFMEDEEKQETDEITALRREIESLRAEVSLNGK